MAFSAVAIVSSFPFNFLINLPQIRTRIPTYDDDNTVLYAYEPNIQVNNVSNINCSLPNTIVVSDISNNEEQQKAVLNILSHCQVIYDAIQNMDKKLDRMHGKVSKIHRLHVKTMWQNHKPLGYAYRNYNYLLSRKNRYKKMKKKGSPSIFSYPESYSPTLPVRRQENESDIQINPIDTSFHSDVPSEPEQLLYGEEEEEPILEESSQVPPNFEYSFKPYFSPEEPMPGPSTTPCFSSPWAPSTGSVFSSARASTTVASTVVATGEGSPSSNPDLGNYGSLENKSFGQQTNSSSVGSPPSFGQYDLSFFLPTEVTSSPVGLEATQNFSKDPSNWSVEEVIQFIEQMDSQTFTPLADLFRLHDIDGKALLLLKSDMMMKYMGLTLGTAVKLCHYIERLKQEKYFHS
ncbi:sex comb on midleg-like protein 1 [Choloepus didactylus]|uniref:sex comb on midleg-like protein 1 n=1 Tax=Choloepus didactylus TaxID=27675 RepID=UPI0018A11B07|nr:sex comb on midleg-like protein 1 [Choloepus didactylus]